jgi:hypothetical protein
LKAININKLQIEAHIKGSRNLDSRTLGFGFTLLHEVLHSDFAGMALNDNELGYGKIGDNEKLLIKIRSEMGSNWGQIQSHSARTVEGSAFIPFDEESKNNIGWYQRPPFNSKYIELKNP